MSQNPTTLPEISSTDDTSPDSLLARLQRITGVTGAVPVRDNADRRIPDGAPPVDRLITVVRDCFAVLAACGVAVSVVIAAGVLWLWCHGKQGARRARDWQREMFAKAAEARVARAKLAQKPVIVTVTETALPLEAPVVAAPPQVSAPVVVAKIPNVENPVRVSPVPVITPVVPLRRFRRGLIAVFVVVLLLPLLWLVKPVRYYFTGLMGWGNAVVIIAEDGWLFPRAESEPAATAPLPLRETAAALRAGGAALVVISVPAKSAVYREKLSGSGGEELQRHPNVAAALKELTDAGVQVLDLGPVLHGMKKSDSAEGFVFSPQSGHWSPRGMAQAAFAAASFIQQQPGYAALPLQPALAVMVPATGMATTDDLVTTLDSPRLQSRYAPQTVPLIRLLSTAKKEPLASDPSSPAVLLGGETVRIYDDPALGHPAGGLPEGQGSSAGFAQHLAWHLSTPLEVHAAASGIEAAKNWLSARAEADRKAKRLVVWLLSDADLLR